VPGGKPGGDGRKGNFRGGGGKRKSNNPDQSSVGVDCEGEELLVYKEIRRARQDKFLWGRTEETGFSFAPIREMGGGLNGRGTVGD